MPRGVTVTASFPICVMVWDECAIHVETVCISSQMPYDTLCSCVQHHLCLNHCKDQRLCPQLSFGVSQVFRFSNSHLCLWLPETLDVFVSEPRVSEWPLVWLRFGLLMVDRTCPGLWCFHEYSSQAERWVTKSSLFNHTIVFVLFSRTNI